MQQPYTVFAVVERPKIIHRTLPYTYIRWTIPFEQWKISCKIHDTCTSVPTFNKELYVKLSDTEKCIILNNSVIKIYISFK